MSFPFLLSSLLHGAVADTRTGTESLLDRVNKLTIIAPMTHSSISFTATLWKWRADGAWHFLTIDPQTSAEIRYDTMGQARHFGSVKVTATIGDTDWQTSLWPHKESGGFIIPVKASVRKAEALAEGDVVRVTLSV